MSQFKLFTGLRTYSCPLQRDLRELEKFLADIDRRVAQLTGKEPLSIYLGNPAIAPHAETHATSRGQTIGANNYVLGSDPIDVYEFDWVRAHLHQMRDGTDVAITLKANTTTPQSANFLNIYDTNENLQDQIDLYGRTALMGAAVTASLNTAPFFNPLNPTPGIDLSSALVFWFDSSNGVQSSGEYGAITSWVDRTGTYTATPGTANTTGGGATNAEWWPRQVYGKKIRVVRTTSFKDHIVKDGFASDYVSPDYGGWDPCADPAFSDTEPWNLYDAWDGDSSAIHRLFTISPTYTVTPNDTITVVTVGRNMDPGTSQGGGRIVMDWNPATEVSDSHLNLWNQGVTEDGLAELTWYAPGGSQTSGSDDTVKMRQESCDSAGTPGDQAGFWQLLVLVLEGEGSKFNLKYVDIWGADKTKASPVSAGNGSNFVIDGVCSGQAEWAHALLFNRELTAAEIAAVRDNFATAFQITTANLMAGQPDNVSGLNTSQQTGTPGNYAAEDEFGTVRVFIDDRGFIGVNTGTGQPSARVTIRGTDPALFAMEYDADTYWQQRVDSSDNLIFQSNEDGKIGIEETSPSAKLHITDDAEQLRLALNTTHYTQFIQSSGTIEFRYPFDPAEFRFAYDGSEYVNHVVRPGTPTISDWNVVGNGLEYFRYNDPVELRLNWSAYDHDFPHLRLINNNVANRGLSCFINNLGSAFFETNALGNQLFGAFTFVDGQTANLVDFFQVLVYGDGTDKCSLRSVFDSSLTASILEHQANEYRWAHQNNTSDYLNLTFTNTAAEVVANFAVTGGTTYNSMRYPVWTDSALPANPTRAEFFYLNRPGTGGALFINIEDASDTWTWVPLVWKGTIPL